MRNSRNEMKGIYETLFCVLCAFVVQASAAEPQGVQPKASRARTLPNAVLRYIDDPGYGVDTRLSVPVDRIVSEMMKSHMTQISQEV